MLNYKKLASDMDKIADRAEAAGLIPEAYALDKIADTLEAMGNFPPEAQELAKQLGITLNKQTAAEIVKKYLGSSAPLGADGTKEAMPVNPKFRSLVMLATILAAGFIADVAAKAQPITVNFPTGAVTYTAKDLKQLEKQDPKSFAVVMDAYNLQQAQAQSRSEISQSNQDRMKGQEKPKGYDKPTKNVEELSDAFGNQGRLITYTDGTKNLEGDIMQGGVSLRGLLERKGDIPFNPKAERVQTDRPNPLDHTK
jgi:hypothetical protein